jgi:hypothetical protein
MSAHTPGPWFMSNDGDSQIRANDPTDASGETTICEVNGTASDARLIAAAPALLAALQAAIAYMPDGHVKANACAVIGGAL